MRLRKAVLIIHGFAGGTYDEEPLANYLELNKHLDVYTFTLPGHDKMIMRKIKMDDWITESEKMVEMLIKNGYNKIYVIGHSMGGVIATFLATKYKNIKKLVLLAPAFNPVVSKNGKINIFGTIKKSPKIMKTYETDDIITRIMKVPLSTVLEFQKLIEKYQDTPKHVTIPTIIIQGTKDQLVPKESSIKIFNQLKSSSKKLVIVNNLTHHVLKSVKTELVLKQIESFLIKHNKIETTKIEM